MTELWREPHSKSAMKISVDVLLKDLVCWIYQELPVPVPVRTRLPPELFGEALMVQEFLQAFGEAFDLKDEFPDGVSLGKSEVSLIRNLLFHTGYCCLYDKEPRSSGGSAG